MKYTFGIVTALSFAACAAEPPSSGPAPAATGGSAQGMSGGPSSNPDPISPSTLQESCTIDAPSPRRILRLSAEELLQSFAAVAPIRPGTVPLALQGGAIPEPPATGLAVTRDFQRDADQVATALAADYKGRVPCDVGSFGADAPCTMSFLRTEGARLLRGRSDERLFANLASLAAGVAERSGGATALRYTLRGLMLSPASLYMTEGLDGAKNGAGQTTLSPVELASYLSFRVNGRPPSESLLAALKAEPELTSTKLAGIVGTELGDGSAELTARFLTSWLPVAGIGALARDQTRHPQATPQLMQGLQDEALQALLTIANDAHAGWSSLLEEPQMSTQLGDGQSAGFAQWGRPGVLTLPGVLALMSAADHTNIPRRGRFLLKSLFCETLQSPPPGAAAQEPPAVPGESERARFDRVGTVPGCNVCHARLNPLAFGLEAYDELGLPRVSDEAGNPIDVKAAFAVRDGQTLTFEAPAEMAARIAADSSAQNCFVMQTYRFVARRDERGSNDACLISDLATRARGAGLNLRELAVDTLAATALAPRAD